MAAAAYFDQIQKIYIAFYQRPADPAGLRYWAGKVNDAGGDLGQVINAFAASTEANTLYGAIDASTIGGVIDSLYLALFDRPPEAAGRQFYIDSMAAGTFTPASIALAVLVGAQERDNDAIAHKLQVANEFTQQVDGRPLSDPEFGDSKGVNSSYAGSDAEAAARAILAGVTADPATVLTPAQVTSTLQQDIAQPGDPILDGDTGGGGGDTGGGGGGGGPAPAPTFTATLDAQTNKITFSGTATGDITFSVDANGLATFTRGGVVATQKLSIADVQSATPSPIKLSAPAANVSVATAQTLNSATWVDVNGQTYSIKDTATHLLTELDTGNGSLSTLLNDATAITPSDAPMAMTAAQFTTPGLAAKLTNGTVTLGDLGSATGGQLAEVIAHIDKIAADGITAITLTQAEASADVLSNPALKDGSVSLSGTVDVAYLIGLGAAASKLAAGSVDMLTFSNDAALQDAAQFIASGAVGTNAITLTDGAITSAKATVMANLDKFKADQVTSITLTDDEVTAAILGNAALKTGSVTIGAVTDTSKAAVLAALDIIADNGISAITLTKSEATSLNALSNSKLQNGSVTLSDAVDGTYLTGLNPTQLTKLAPGGITAITLTEAQATADLLANAVLKDGSVTIGAVTDTSKAAVLAALNKIADNGITAITLDEAQANQYLNDAAFKIGSVTLGVVTDTSKAAVLAALDKMAADGITTITLTTAQATAEVLAHPAFKSGSVTLSGTVDQAYLSSLGAAASKLATGSVQTITFVNDADLQAAAQLIASDAVAADSILLANGAITSAKATVLANLGKFKADQVASITLTDDEVTAAILGNAALQTGSVTIGAVTDTSKAAVLAALNKIADNGISAITLTKSEANGLLAQHSSVLQAGSVTISDGVDLAFLNSLADLQLAEKMAPGGISAITLAKEQATTAVLGNPLVGNGSVTISDAVDAAFLDTLTADNTLAKIAVGGISKMTLTEAQATADFLANPILKDKSVTIGAVTDISKAAVLGALSKMADSGITAITLTKDEATAAVMGSSALAGKVDGTGKVTEPGSVTINETLSKDELFALSNGWNKIAVGGITDFNATAFVEAGSGNFSFGFVTLPMFAEHSITFGRVKADSPSVAMEAVVVQKVAAGGITSISMNSEAALFCLQGNGELGAWKLVGDRDAFKAGSITLVEESWTPPLAGVYAGAKKTVLITKSKQYLKKLDMSQIEKLTTGSVITYIDQFITDQITSITLTSEQATGAILEKPALKAGSVTLSDAVDGNYVAGLNAAQLNKIAVDGISAITLTKAQATAELLGSAALKAGSVTLSDAVDAAYLTGLSAAQLAKIAENGISAITDSAANLQTYTTAHPGVLQAFDGATVILTDNSTLEQVAALRPLMANSTWTYSLTDDPATLVNLTPEQIALVQGASNAASYDVEVPTLASVTGNGTKVVLTFSEDIQAGSGNIVIKTANGDGEVAIIAVGSAVIAGKTLTLTLPAALDTGTAYYIEATASAVKDTVGNDFAGVTGAASTTGFTAAASVFDVTLVSANYDDPSYGLYRVGTDHGTVTITGSYDQDLETSNYTFTPQQGTAKTVSFPGELQLQIDAPLTLKGDAETLSEMSISGTGTVAITKLEESLNAYFSAIETSVVTADFAAGAQDQVSLHSGANLGNAKITISSGTLNITEAAIGKASFEVLAGAGLMGEADQLSVLGVAATGAGRVTVSNLTTTTDLSCITTTVVNARIESTVNLSANAQLGTVTEYMVNAGQTVTLTAAQLDAAVVSGQGGVMVLGSDGAQTLSIETTGTNTINAGGGADHIILAEEDGADTVLVKLGVAQQEENPSKVTFNMSFSPEIDYGEFSIKIAGVNTGNPVVMEDLYVSIGGPNLATAIQGHLRAVDGNRTDISVLWNDPGQLTITDMQGRAFSGVSLAGYDYLMQGFVDIGSNVQITASTTATSEVLSDSYLGAFDTITNFKIGTDKIDLLTASGDAVGRPTDLVRVADVASSDDLTVALASAFAALTPNQAGLVVIAGGTAAGTYLYADNGNGTFDAGADVFIQLVGVADTLGAVGELTVSNFFA